MRVNEDMLREALAEDTGRKPKNRYRQILDGVEAYRDGDLTKREAADGIEELLGHDWDMNVGNRGRAIIEATLSRFAKGEIADREDAIRILVAPGHLTPREELVAATDQHRTPTG